MEEVAKHPFFPSPCLSIIVGDNMYLQPGVRMAPSCCPCCTIIKELIILKIKRESGQCLILGGMFKQRRKHQGNQHFSLCQWHIYLPKIKNCNLHSCPLSALKVKMWKYFKREYQNMPLKPAGITLALGMGLPATCKHMRPFSQPRAAVGENRDPRNQSLSIRSTATWQGSQ